MTRILLKTQIEAPPADVFDLARDIDLHQEAARESDEKAVAGVTSGLVELGSSVTWRARHFGIWQELTVVITDFNAPKMFADEMVRGSFKKMRHVHSFESSGNGTLMTDEFAFETPFGILGVLVERLILEKYMRTFLVKRNRFLKATAEKQLRVV